MFEKGFVNYRLQAINYKLLNRINASKCVDNSLASIDEEKKEAFLEVFNSMRFLSFYEQLNFLSDNGIEHVHIEDCMPLDEESKWLTAQEIWLENRKNNGRT